MNLGLYSCGFSVSLSKRTTTGANIKIRERKYMISDEVKVHVYKNKHPNTQIHIKDYQDCSSNRVQGKSADHDYRETSVISAPLKAADSR